MRLQGRGLPSKLKRSLLLPVAAGLCTLGGCTTLKVKEDDFLPPSSASDSNYKFVTDWEIANLASEPPSYKRLPTDVRSVDPCKRWSELSKPNWPLQELAKLRALQFCGPNELSNFANLENPSSLQLGLSMNSQNSKTKDNTDSINSILLQAPEAWLRGEWILAKLHQAQVQDDKFELARLLLDFSKTLTKKAEKEKHLRSALDQAEKIEISSRPEVENLKTMIRNELYRVAPRFKPNPSALEYIDVANDMRTERRFKEALALFDQVLRDPNQKPDAKIKALKNKRMTQKAMQDVDASMASAEALYAYTKSLFDKEPNESNARSFLDGGLTYARARWTEGQPKEAEYILLSVAKPLQGKVSLIELNWVLGKIAEERGDNETTKSYFEKAFKARNGASGALDKVLWSRAWLDYKMKDYSAAAAKFEESIPLLKDAFDKNKFNYWKARSLLAAGQSENGKSVLSDLIRDEPLSFYAAMAHQILNQSFEALQSIPPDRESVLSKILAPRANATFEWLVKVNEKDLAQSFLSQLDFPKALRNSEDFELTMLKAYAHAGLYTPLFSKFGTLPNELKRSITSAHWDLLFPTPWRQEVLTSSKENGIPAEFVYAIMRQESAFNPEARSSVDAMGLLQLMPALGKSLASKIPDSGLQTELDLLKPEVNIKLGSAELSNLLRRQKGQYALAVASYNANEKSIRGWISSRGRKDLTEFIEEIPYEETRTYVKLVFRNFIWYRRSLNLNQSVAFPNELLLWHYSDK